MVLISMLSPHVFIETFEFESSAFLEGSRTLFPMSDYPEDTPSRKEEQNVPRKK